MIPKFGHEIQHIDWYELKWLTTLKNRRTKITTELFSPISTIPHSCIILPTTTATHFELKSCHHSFTNFHGLKKEDPNMHIKEFLKICSTFKFHSVKLRLFSFSLKDKAKAWLNSLPSGSITTWDALVQNFLSKFVAMSKTNALWKEVTDSYQLDHKMFLESWARFKDLILKCLHHGF